MGYSIGRPSLDASNAADAAERRSSEDWRDRENADLRRMLREAQAENQRLKGIIRDARDKLAEGFR